MSNRRKQCLTINSSQRSSTPSLILHEEAQEVSSECHPPVKILYHKDGDMSKKGESVRPVARINYFIMDSSAKSKNDIGEFPRFLALAGASVSRSGYVFAHLLCQS
jgi:hypothetical protein